MHEIVLNYELQKNATRLWMVKAILVVTFAFCYDKEYKSARIEKKVNSARFLSSNRALYVNSLKTVFIS